MVGLDVGGLVQGFGRQAELKFQTLVEGKLKMGYDAIAFGADDLRLPAGELVSVAAGVDGKPSLFVSANVGLLGMPGEITPHEPRHRGRRHEDRRHRRPGQEVSEGNSTTTKSKCADPEAALEKIVPELKQKADYLVLLAHATMEESDRAGARSFPIQRRGHFRRAARCRRTSRRRSQGPRPC